MFKIIKLDILSHDGGEDKQLNDQSSISNNNCLR